MNVEQIEHLGQQGWEITVLSIHSNPSSLAPRTPLGRRDVGRLKITVLKRPTKLQSQIQSQSKQCNARIVFLRPPLICLAHHPGRRMREPNRRRHSIAVLAARP